VAVLVLVLAFVVLGIGTLLFAMSGGRGGLGSVLHSQSRGSRRLATFGFFAALFLLGIVVPGWVIASELNKDELPYAQVSELTEDEKHGQELFGTRCSMCHALKASNAVARVGPDLDAIAPNAQVTLDAIEKGRSNGNGQMPAGLFTGKDAEDVAKYVAKSVGADESSGG
jgi:mono/diheme cytochrome c family protein